jgi:hypothetical protein
MLTPLRASWLDGLVDADPMVVGILIGAIVVCAVAFVIVRLRARRGSGP